MNIITVVIIFIVGILLAFPLAIILLLPFGWLISKKRFICGNCTKKKLKEVNFIKCNPPPAFACFKCEECEAKFIRYSGDRDFKPIEETGISPALCEENNNTIGVQ